MHPDGSRRSLHVSGTASLEAKFRFPGYPAEPAEENADRRGKFTEDYSRE